jgi:type IV pilus assembly protein PilM
MPVDKPVWGIDLGESTLKAIKLVEREGQIEVESFDIVEHPQILSQPDADQPALIRQALDAFTSRNDISGCDVVVGVPGTGTFSKFGKLPPVDQKQVAAIVEYEAEQQIPFAIEEVVWDYQTFQDEEAIELELGIFAIRKSILHEMIDYLSEFQIEPKIVQMTPLAIFNFVRFDQQAGDFATVVLDIGAQNTDLVIVDGDRVWVRNVPLGGNNFTDALVRSFKLSFAKAENLKRTAATSKYARQIFQAMRPVFADLVAEIQRSIGYYASLHRDAQMEKVLCLGNAFRLPGLQKYLEQNLQLPVNRVRGFKMLTPSPAINTNEFSENVLGFSCAYGLAVQGLGHATVVSNLLPSEIHKRQLWRVKTPWFAAAAACMLMVAGIVWFRTILNERAYAGGGDERKSYQVVAKDAKESRNEYTALKSETTNVEKHLDQLTELYVYREYWPKIYQLFVDALPPLQPELAMAKTGKDYASAIEEARAEGKDLAFRDRRREIYIDSFEPRFEPELSQMVALLKEDWNAAPVTSGNTPGVRKGSGYAITINGWTPNAGGPKWVNQYIDKLIDLSIKSGDLPFEIAFVDMKKVGKRGSFRQGGARRRGGGGPGGLPGRGGPPGMMMGGPEGMMGGDMGMDGGVGGAGSSIRRAGGGSGARFLRDRKEEEAEAAAPRGVSGVPGMDPGMIDGPGMRRTGGRKTAKPKGNVDPLTEEETENDSGFEIVVYLVFGERADGGAQASASGAMAVASR